MVDQFLTFFECSAGRDGEGWRGAEAGDYGAYRAALPVPFLVTRRNQVLGGGDRQTETDRRTDKERETERGAHSDTREDTRRGKRAVDRCGGSGSGSGSGRGAGWLALDAERPDRGGRRDPSVSLARALPLLFSPIIGGRRRFAGVPGRAHSPMGVQRVLVCSLERRTRSAPEGWAR